VTQFIFFANPWLLPTALLVVLALSIELPYRFAGSFMAQHEVKGDAWNAAQSRLLTLMAFVLGLSFAQASARFDTRRALVVEEANAIATTWLRADQLPAAQVGRFRHILTDYAT
jgi:hypothetical protein